jgi:hypothetical protein
MTASGSFFDPLNIQLCTINELTLSTKKQARFALAHLLAAGAVMQLREVGTQFSL